MMTTLPLSEVPTVSNTRGRFRRSLLIYSLWLAAAGIAPVSIWALITVTPALGDAATLAGGAASLLAEASIFLMYRMYLRERTAAAGYWEAVEVRWESEAKYRQLFEHTSDCIFHIDVTPDGRFKFAGFNPAEEKAIGFRDAETNGKFVEEIAPADAARDLVARYRLCVATGSPIEYDEELDLPIGRRSFHTFLVPLRGRTGQIHQIIGIARDVTDAKQFKEALRASEEAARCAHARLIDAIDSMQHSLTIWDAEERLVMVNTTARNTGWTMNPGTLYVDAMTQLARSGWLPGIEGREEEFLRGATLRHRDPTHEPLEYRLKTGRWVSVRRRRTGDGGVVATATDVTELKWIEQRLHNVLDGIPALVSYWDAEGRNRYANQRFGQRFGIASKELHGRHAREILGEEAYAEYLPRLQRVLRGEAQSFEHMLALPSGARRCYQFVLTPDRLDEAVVGYYVLGTDVTDMKQTEERLRTAQLDAENASRAKSEFLAQMSHELRTPLNAVIGFAEVIRDRMFGDDAIERYANYAKDIAGAGQHLQELVESILDFTALDAGGLNLSLTYIRVADTLSQVHKLAVTAAEKACLRLEVKDDTAVDVRVLADGLRLRQLLLNLISNAIKYNKAAGWVHISASFCPKGTVRFKVSDGGIGIASDVRHRLFRPFERLHATHIPIDGTGIGLALVKRLAEAMDGTVGCHSEFGIGSTFWVDLPAVRLRPLPGGDGLYGIAPSP